MISTSSLRRILGTAATGRAAPAKAGVSTLGTDNSTDNSTDRSCDDR